MPDEFGGGVGVFACEGVWQVDFAEAVFEVSLVDDFYSFYLQFEMGDERVWEDGEAVVFAFSVTDDDLAVAEVYVFDAEAEAFHEAQSGAVEDLGHELGDVFEVGDDGEGFLVGEDGGEGFGFFGADDVGGELDVLVEDVAVEEEDGGERLVLGGGGDVLFDGEVGEEGLNFGDAHFFGVAFAVVEDVAFDPFGVGFFGAVGVVFEADGLAELLEEFGWFLHG